MLVLISFVLVLVAAGLLVVGLLQDGSALIYASIAASVIAGVILGVAVRSNRPKTATADGDAAVDQAGATATTAIPTQTSAPVSEDPVTAAVPVVAVAAAPATPARPAAVAVVDDVEDELDDDELADEELEAGGTELEDDLEVQADDEYFPIADYDELRVSEILPLLPQLYADELDIVEEREQEGKARKTILARLEELRAGADDETDGGIDAGGELADEDEDELDEAIEDEEAADERPAVAVDDEEWAAADDDWEEGFFPIADYDELRVAEIVPLLSQLTQDELVEVREREDAGAGRKSILDNIDRRLDTPPARRPAKAAPARRSSPSNGTSSRKQAPSRSSAPTRTAAASRAGGRSAGVTAPAPATRKAAATTAKAPATRAAAAKKAAPAKRSAATKSSATKSSAAKASATKAPAKRSTARR